jgi:hypothetical protein
MHYGTGVHVNQLPKKRILLQILLRRQEMAELLMSTMSSTDECKSSDQHCRGRTLQQST